MITDEMNFAGIYAIWHVTDGKVYVGQSQNIALRIRQHRSPGSGCTHIKNAIQAHGWTEFEVSVLEAIEDFEILDSREEYWIGALNATDPGNGYNICSVAGSCRGVKHGLEARARMSAAKVGKTLPVIQKANVIAARKRRAELQRLNSNPKKCTKIMLLPETRRALKLAAALQETTIIELVHRLATAELARVQGKQE